MKSIKLADGTEIKGNTTRLQDIFQDVIFPFRNLMDVLKTDDWDEEVCRASVYELFRQSLEIAEQKFNSEIDTLESRAGIIELFRADQGTSRIKPGDLVAVLISPLGATSSTPVEQPKKILSASSEDIPDFRTVKPETEEEAQLQRAFEVMRVGGWNRDFLEKAISVAWESNIRGEGLFLDKASALCHKGLVKKDEESEHAGGEASGA